MLAESRAFGVSMILAHQHLGQLHRELREGMSTNARNKVFFNASPEDARELSRHTAPRLSEHDLAHLGVYHAAVRLVLGGEEAQPFTMLTQPLPPAIPGRAREIRRIARRNAHARATEADPRASTAQPGARQPHSPSGPGRSTNRSEPVVRPRNPDPRRR